MAIGPDCRHEIVGVRPGEKIHEEMITLSDSISTYNLGTYYSILPYKLLWKLEDYVHHFKATRVEDGFSYNSGKNDQWLSVEDIRTLIKEHVDPDFSI
jgi:FlaA1/EpsC-like NDP-sugar epimerase